MNKEKVIKKILETIFSVKNRTVINEKEKILTIFGIKVILSSVPIYIYIRFRKFGRGETFFPA